MLAALYISAQQTGASCGSANTVWEGLGGTPHPGWTLDLRYECLQQDSLRAGSDKTEPAGVSDTHDEISALNRHAT